jgi:ubiquinone/menaquinone biosynthesis C-methylase UbiE
MPETEASIETSKPFGKLSGYSLDNSWDRAKRRLSLLERQLDPITQRRLTALGIQNGLRCLEVAAGAGSVAVWLCKQVGSTGRVVATDINIELLQNINRPNFEAVKHDITIDSPLDGGFDLVHARWLLHHLREPELAIRRMIEALRPGGWLLLEEVDLFPVHTSTSRLYVDFMVALTNTVVRASGRNCFWARALPRLVAGMALRQVGGEGDFSVLQGGSPVAEFFSLTAEQIRERIIESGELTEERLNEALDLLKSPDFWAFGTGTVAVWGQRPN